MGDRSDSGNLKPQAPPAPPTGVRKTLVPGLPADEPASDEPATRGPTNGELPTDELPTPEPATNEPPTQEIVPLDPAAEFPEHTGPLSADEDAHDRSAEVELEPAGHVPGPGALLDGKFRLIKQIGSGGSGVVYAAEQVSLGRLVAIKLLVPELDPEGLQRFEERFFREASAAGALQHPNVVTVHDFGRTHEGAVYIAMELLNGKTLKQLMRNGPLPPERACDIFLQIARGLRAAHQAGLVHRDVKPGNVWLVAGEADRDYAKVLDFGLVKPADPEKALEAEITGQGLFIGTPHYCSPEQARGLGADPRSDIYAYGVMLYRALSGRLPYTSRSTMAIAIAHVREPYPPMSSRAPTVQVSPRLEAIVRRCMMKEPGRRYPDMDALIADFEAVRAALFAPQSGPASVSTVGVPVEGLGWRKGLVAAGVAATLLGGVAGVSWLGRTPPAEELTFSEAPPILVEAPAREVMVIISSEPSGATVHLGELWVGTTPLAHPLTLAVDEGGAAGGIEQIVTVALDGYAAWTGTITLDGDEVSQHVRLEALAKVKSASERLPKGASTGARVGSGGGASPAAPPARGAADSPAGGEVSADGGEVSADGVRFTAVEAARTLAFLNESPREGLVAAGIAGRQANIILEQRPFASVVAFAAVPYIGEKTVVAAKEAAR